jgi:death-on-curing protein
MTVWLSRQIVLAVHDEQLGEHGGASGIRDEGLLESALARPLNLAGYGEPDVVELAATYAIAIARNHPFIDGNKRTAYVAMVLFLSLNGLVFRPTDQAAAVITMLNMAAHDIADVDFTLWVRANAVLRE